MRLSYAFILIATLATPATPVAADENLRQVVEKIASAYADNIEKQNAAGIAALFSDGALLVNNGGQVKNIAEYYDDAFKAGFNHDEVKFDQVQPLGTDALIATGEFHLTGKDASGAPIETAGLWTAVDVREGGTWKIRMLSAFPRD